MKLTNKFTMARAANAFAAMLLTLVNAQVVLAAPTGGRVVKGSANIEQTAPSRTDINQSSDKAIINWNDFSIKEGESVNFNQPGRSSVTLNRVTGGSISDIQGALRANGNVFLINPNGIVFGQGSVVDVAGLVASTANIRDEDFMAGKYTFTGSGSGSVINEGKITVKQGGLVAMVAPSVRNTGVIQARLGRVALVSGNTFTVDLYGDGLVKLAVDGKVAKGLAENSGTISANGGKVLISAQAAKNIVDNVINMDGVVQAQSIADNSGSIVLSGGVVRVAGTLDASGAAQAGGDIDVLGDSITVAGNVDASGTSGGIIHIGGDYQGKGNRQRASETLISQSATIQANSDTVGNGGQVIVWSDKQTNVNGQISAKGGSKSGNGGFVETSSAGQLDFTTSVDVKASNGKAGTWLIDPENITIDRDYADLIEDSLNNGSSVVVQTADGGLEAGNLNVDASITKSSGDDAALSLLAHNDLNVNAPITSTSGKLDVNLKAGNSINVNSKISTNGGGFYASKWEVASTTSNAQTKDDLANQNETAVDEKNVPEQEVNPAVGVENILATNEAVPVEPIVESNLTDNMNTAIGAAEPAAISVPAVIATVEPKVDGPITVSETPAISPVQTLTAIVPESVPTTTIEQPIAGATAILVVANKTALAATPLVKETTLSGINDDSVDINITENGAIETSGGDILLIGGDQSNVQVDGVLDSSSDVNNGGDIVVSGNNITVSGTATLDSRGVGTVTDGVGGGDIILGVDVTNDAKQLADTVVIAQNSRIMADGKDLGDGGNVIINSRVRTDFHGFISAFGGFTTSEQSKGGVVIITGQDELNNTGLINMIRTPGRGNFETARIPINPSIEIGQNLNPTLPPVKTPPNIKGPIVRPPTREPMPEPRPPVEDPVSEPRPPVEDPVSEPRPPVEDPVSEPRPPVEDPVSEPRPPAEDPVSEPTPPEEAAVPEIVEQPDVVLTDDVVINDESSNENIDEQLLALNKDAEDSETLVKRVANNKSSSNNCSSSNNLAWLQSGIRSAAETADMGRGDGISGTDVFNNCY